jgi:hypothetical protein
VQKHLRSPARLCARDLRDSRYLQARTACGNRGGGFLHEPKACREKEPYAASLRRRWLLGGGGHLAVNIAADRNVRAPGLGEPAPVAEAAGIPGADGDVAIGQPNSVMGMSEALSA